jgi:hypothetical protein
VTVSSGDTSREAAEFQLQAWQRLGAEARVEMVAQLSEQIREISLAGIRQRHPGYTDDQARRALLRLVVGDELVLTTWPGQPLVEP